MVEGKVMKEKVKEFVKKKGFIKAISAGVIIIACIFIYAGFSERPQSYMTSVVTVGPVAEKVNATGKVCGENEKTYYAGVSAPVSEIEIEVGDAIKSGSRILSYELTDLQKVYDEAFLNIEMSESGLSAKMKESDKNAAKYNKAEADEEIYKILYAWSRGDADSISQEQYAEAYNIKCQYDSIEKSIAEKSKTSAEKTSELTGITDKTSDAYKNLSKEIADLNVEVAKLQKDLTTLPSENMTPEENEHITYDSNLMEDIIRNWTQATTDAASSENLILNEDQKEQLVKGHELAKLSLVTAEENLACAKEGVDAEFSGVVTEVFVESGAVVAKGIPLFSIENSEDLKVKVELSKYDISKVKIGKEADITIADNIYSGSVTEIKRLAVEDTSDKAKVTAEVHIENPDENIILGIEADVDIYTEEKENVLLIPIEAFYSDDMGDYCYTIAGGLVEKKYIKVGILSDTFVEIAEGINKGDIVITDAITDDRVGKKAVAK
jgi:RND family efflux transporter MFP subunit